MTLTIAKATSCWSKHTQAQPMQSMEIKNDNFFMMIFDLLICWFNCLQLRVSELPYETFCSPLCQYRKDYTPYGLTFRL